jgi:hypothetical protein
MKLRSRVPLFVALAFTVGQPPPVEGQDLYLGVRGGISVIDYSLPYLSEDWRSGVVAGAFLAIPLRSHVSLQPEVAWVLKGATWFREGIGPTRGELDYTAFTVLARLSLPLGGFSLSVLGGPWVGILSRCGTDDSRDVSSDCDSIFGIDEHRTADFGWDVGVGAAVQTGPFLVQLDLRRSRGVSKLLKDRPMDNPTTKSTQLSLGFGYRISGG